MSRFEDDGVGDATHLSAVGHGLLTSTAARASRMSLFQSHSSPTYSLSTNFLFQRLATCNTFSTSSNCRFVFAMPEHARQRDLTVLLQLEHWLTSTPNSEIAFA